MKVLIVDDEPLAREELRYLLEANPQVATIQEAAGVGAASRLVTTEHPDLVFLDIQLTDGNGIALANRWQELATPPAVVFATAYDQYALDAFDAAAVDYVLKPFEADRIAAAVARVAKRLGQASQAVPAPVATPRLAVTSDDRTVVLQKKELTYLEAKGGTVHVHTAGHVVTSRQSLTTLLTALDPAHFLRVHRSFVVNLEQVVELQPAFNHTYELTLTDGSKVPVSRSYVTATKQALGI